jgi:hypothetical protein
VRTSNVAKCFNRWNIEMLTKCKYCSIDDQCILVAQESENLLQQDGVDLLVVREKIKCFTSYIDVFVAEGV